MLAKEPYMDNIGVYTVSFQFKSGDSGTMMFGFDVDFGYIVITRKKSSEVTEDMIAGLFDSVVSHLNSKENGSIKGSVEKNGGKWDIFNSKKSYM